MTCWNSVKIPFSTLTHNRSESLAGRLRPRQDQFSEIHTIHFIGFTLEYGRQLSGKEMLRISQKESGSRKGEEGSLEKENGCLP